MSDTPLNKNSSNNINTNINELIPQAKINNSKNDFYFTKKLFSGASFGELALTSHENKRTAHIETNVNCEFAILKRKDF